jgi:hypothetical protein
MAPEAGRTAVRARAAQRMSGGCPGAAYPQARHLHNTVILIHMY